QHTRKYLHRRLPGHEPEALAQLNRAAGDAVQQSRGARIVDRRAGRIDGSSRAVVRGQSISQRHHLWPGRAAKDHAERVEQDALGVLAHGDGDILQLGFSGEARKRFNLLAHGPAPVPLPRWEYPNGSTMPVVGGPAVTEVRWTSLRRAIP